MATTPQVVQDVLDSVKKACLGLAATQPDRGDMSIPGAQAFYDLFLSKEARDILLDEPLSLDFSAVEQKARLAATLYGTLSRVPREIMGVYDAVDGLSSRMLSTKDVLDAMNAAYYDGEGYINDPEGVPDDETGDGLVNFFRRSAQELNPASGRLVPVISYLLSASHSASMVLHELKRIAKEGNIECESSAVASARPTY